MLVALPSKSGDRLGSPAYRSQFQYCASFTAILVTVRPVRLVERKREHEASLGKECIYRLVSRVAALIAQRLLVRPRKIAVPGEEIRLQRKGNRLVAIMVARDAAAYPTEERRAGGKKRIRGGGGQHVPSHESTRCARYVRPRSRQSDCVRRAPGPGRSAAVSSAGTGRRRCRRVAGWVLGRSWDEGGNLCQRRWRKRKVQNPPKGKRGMRDRETEPFEAPRRRRQRAVVC